MAVIGASFVGTARFTSSTRTSPDDLRLLVHRTSSPCRPSPWARLSRALTTMAPPTLAWFTGGLLTSARKPPAFTEIDSARPCRQRFAADQSCSSQYPEREQGRPSGLLQPIKRSGSLGRRRDTPRFVRCPLSSTVTTPPIRRSLWGRGPVSRRSKPASCALALWSLRQPRRLDGLLRLSPVAFLASSFTPALHSAGATAIGLIFTQDEEWEDGRTSVPPFCLCASRRTRRTGPFQGQLFHARVASADATPQGLIASLIEAVGVSLHFI